MKTNQIVKIILLLSMLASSTLFAADPVGYWAAKDDSTGKVLSIIQMWQAKDGSYNGRIYKIMDVVVDGKQQLPTDTCEACSGNLAHKPMLCMQVVYGMQHSSDDANTWENGSAYDPKSGHNYHAKMWLENDGKTLNLRGYIMMPLLGRTQEWQRVDKPAMSDRVCKRSIADSYVLQNS